MIILNRCDFLTPAPLKAVKQSKHKIKSMQSNINKSCMRHKAENKPKFGALH